MYCNRRACHSDAIDINKSLSECTIIHNNSHNHLSQLIQSHITMYTILCHNIHNHIHYIYESHFI